MSDTAATPAGAAPQFSGGALILGGLLLAAANFLVVLDTTIANVAVPHIAGGLAVSPSQGTYVITSYAVAEAVSVPLTGWLASRCRGSCRARGFGRGRSRSADWPSRWRWRPSWRATA